MEAEDGSTVGCVCVCVFRRSENGLTKLMFPGATAKKQQSFKVGEGSNGDG